MSRHKIRKAEVRKTFAERLVKRTRIEAAVEKEMPLFKNMLAEKLRIEASMGEPLKLLAELYRVTGAEVYAQAGGDLMARGYDGPDWKERIAEDLGVWADPDLGMALERMDHLINDCDESVRGAAALAAENYALRRPHTEPESLADYLRTAYRKYPGPDRWPGRKKAAPGMEPPGRMKTVEEALPVLMEMAELFGMDIDAELKAHWSKIDEELAIAGLRPESVKK